MAIELKFSKFDDTPWGFRLTGGSDYGVPLTVIRVYEGGLSEKIGLKEGDQLYQLNGECMMQVTHEAAHEIITRAGNNFHLAVLRGQSFQDPQMQQVDPFAQPILDSEPVTFQSTRELHPLCQSQAAQVSSIIEHRFTNNLTPKVYRPFSKKIPSDIPPLENPLILSPNHLDEFQTIKQQEWKEMASKLNIQNTSNTNHVEERSQSSCSTNSQKKIIEEELIVTGKVLIDLNEIENSVKDAVDKKSVKSVVLENHSSKQDSNSKVCTAQNVNLTKKSDIKDDVKSINIIEHHTKDTCIKTAQNVLREDKIDESSVIEDASMNVKETITKFSKTIQDTNESIARSKANKVIGSLESTCESKNDGISLEDAKSSALHAASALSQHAKQSSFNVPCAVANIKTQKQTDMLLKTFFVHLTDVMVALTQMIQNDESIKCCACNCPSDCKCVLNSTTQTSEENSIVHNEKRQKMASLIKEYAANEISSNKKSTEVSSSVRKTVEKPPDEREIIVNGSIETGRIMKEVIQNTMGVDVTVEGKDPLEWLADLDGRKTPSYYISKVTCVQTGVVDDEVQNMVVDVEEKLSDVKEETSVVVNDESHKMIDEKIVKSNEIAANSEEISYVVQENSKKLEQSEEFSQESLKKNKTEEICSVKNQAAFEKMEIDTEKIKSSVVEVDNFARNDSKVMETNFSQQESFKISESSLVEMKNQVCESVSRMQESSQKRVSNHFESVQASQVHVEEKESMKKDFAVSVVEKSAIVNIESSSSKQMQSQVCESKIVIEEETPAPVNETVTKKDIKPMEIKEIIEEAVIIKDKGKEEQPKDPSTPNTDEYLFRLDIKLSKSPDRVKKEYVKQPSMHEDLSIVRRPGFVLGDVNIEENSTNYSKNNKIIQDPIEVVEKSGNKLLLGGIKDDPSSSPNTFSQEEIIASLSVSSKEKSAVEQEATISIPNRSKIITSVREDESQNIEQSLNKNTNMSSIENAGKMSIEAENARKSANNVEASSVENTSYKVSEEAVNKSMELCSVESVQNSSSVAVESSQESSQSLSKNVEACTVESVSKIGSATDKNEQIYEKEKHLKLVEKGEITAEKIMESEQKKITQESLDSSALANKKRVAFSLSNEQQIDSHSLQKTVDLSNISSNLEVAEVERTFTGVKIEDASSSVKADKSVSLNACSLHESKSDSYSVNTVPSKMVALPQHERPSLDIAKPPSDLHDKEPKEEELPKQNGISNGTHSPETNTEIEVSQINSLKNTDETSHVDSVEMTTVEEASSVMTMGAAQKNFATVEAPKINTVNGNGIDNDDILDKPGITDEEIAEIISGEAEVLKEQHVLGLQKVIASHMKRPDDELNDPNSSSVDFGKMMPTCEYLKRSEVFKLLNDEAIKTAAERMQEQRKWTKFLQRPDRPVPFCKRHVDQLASEEPPYRVNIKKQPKKEQDLLGHSILTEGVFLIPEVPILIPEPSPQYFEAPEYLADSAFPDLEETGIPIPEAAEEQAVIETEKNIEEGECTENGEKTVENEEELNKPTEEDEKVADDSKEWSDPMLVDEDIDENLPVTEQLLKVQKQLTALSKLPAAIQQTLDLVTKQLGKMVPGSISSVTTVVEKEEPTQNGDEAMQNGEECQQNGEIEAVQNGDDSVEIAVNGYAPTSETDVETEEEVTQNGINGSESVNEVMMPELSQDSKAIVVDDNTEELSKKTGEEINIEKMKKDLVAELSKDQAIRKRGPRPAFGPLTPQQRAVVLPGGRRWRKPKDAYDDAFIAETLSAQASIITGTTLGKFESDHLPYDERVNFMKYEKPPKTLDHLKNSSVFKLVHELDAPLHGIEDRNGGVLLAESEYRERCRSVTPSSFDNQNGNGVSIKADS